MRILIDSGDVGAIRQALATGYVTGVTTNPTLLRRAGVRAADVAALARASLSAGAEELHLQVYADDAPGMVSDARQLVAYDEQHVFAKLPATAAGYRAAAKLTEEGIRVTLTAVYTLEQAVLAASIGARYVAVYLGRMRDAGMDALALVGEMEALFRAQRSDTDVLAASVREASEIVSLARLGVAAATLPPALLGQLPESEATAHAAATFAADARSLFEE